MGESLPRIPPTKLSPSRNLVWSKTPYSVAYALDPDARMPSGRRPTSRIHMFDAIIELMIADHALTLKDIASRLGRSAVWVSYIVRSDAFRDLYERRRREANQQIHQDVAESLARVAMKGLAKIEHTFDNNPAKITPSFALEVASMGLEKLGYGVKLPGSPITQVNVNTISPEDFVKAQAIVRSAEAAPAPNASVVSLPTPQTASLGEAAKPVAPPEQERDLNEILASLDSEEGFSIEGD